MKKLLPFLVAFIITNVYGQLPQLLNYQAVVRDNTGTIIANNTAVKLRFSIHDGSISGPSVFTETQSTVVNRFGLVNVQIGSVNNLGVIHWGNVGKYLQVEIDVNNSGTFTDMGTSQLISVPYALYAGSSSSAWNLTGNSGTDTASFLGTTDFTTLNFRVNGVPSGRIEPAGLNSSTAFGYNSLSSNTNGFQNTAFGNNAMNSNITGSNNTAVGVTALAYGTVGNNNTGIGLGCLQSNTVDDNTAVGSRAMAANSIGIDNSALGSGALNGNISGYYNTAVGFQALYVNSSASDNTAVGYNALYWNNGDYNTAVGVNALQANTTGYMNTACGYLALSNIITGTDNVAVGENSGTSADYFNTVSIGNHGYLNGFSNQAFIGNTSTTWNGGNVTWSTYSDARVKNNVQEDVKGLDFINRLRPVTYYRSIKAMTEITGNNEIADYSGKYEVEKIKFSGFLAQEVEIAAKSSGYNFSGITIPRNDKELYTLSYEQFVVPLVKAVQEQQQQIEELKKEVQELKKK